MLCRLSGIFSASKSCRWNAEIHHMGLAWCEHVKTVHQAASKCFCLRDIGLVDHRLKQDLKCLPSYPWDGGGFFLLCEDFGRIFHNSFTACALFLFFLKWRLACTNWFHSLGQDQSTVAQRAETTMTECSLTSYVWAHFLIDSHTLPWQWHSQPTPTLMGQGCMHV